MSLGEKDTIFLSFVFFFFSRSNAILGLSAKKYLFKVFSLTLTWQKRMTRRRNVEQVKWEQLIQLTPLPGEK